MRWCKMGRVVIVEIIRPSVGGFDVKISHSYEEILESFIIYKHFKDFDELLKYINEDLENG